MGLDITAYSHLNYIGHHEAGEKHPYDIEAGEREHIEAYSYAIFAGHALSSALDLRPVDGLPDIAMITAGCFEVTDATETYGFRAGSYNGYSLWRNDLAARFNPYRPYEPGTEPDPGKPFYELLWFADNEGTLCTEAVRNLLDDFLEHSDAYAQALENDYNGAYFIDRYADWTRACELAAENGLIDFG